MSGSEIMSEPLVGGFGEAARRAQAAGFEAFWWKGSSYCTACYAKPPKGKDESACPGQAGDVSSGWGD